MRIKAPITSVEDITALINCGADEFYAGMDSKIIFGESNLSSVNRRPWANCNFNSLGEFKKAVDCIHKHQKKIFLTLNEHHYSDVQIESMVDFAKNNREIDGYIVADITLMIALKEAFNDLNLAASVGTHVMNSQAAAFYEKFGVKEIVLPRHLTVSEISAIISGNSAAFQFLIKEDECLNIDGYCRYTHGVYEGLACDLLCDFAGDEYSAKVLNKNKRFYKVNCKACMIKDLKNAGVGSLKIAGRGRGVNHVAKDVHFIRSALTLVLLDKSDFMKKVQEAYGNIYKSDCPEHCIYKLKQR